MDMVRLVSSGTEATMSAIRLARGFTGRDKIVKFEGCYHGHADSLLVKAGSGALTFGNPSSDGVPADLARDTLVLDYNAPHELARVFHEHGRDIACIIVEPVAGNMNLIAPRREFLEAMRELCDQYGSVLIFDEVMTGFRVGLGSAQGLYGITPDLSTFGKVVGGGMPLGAFGGRREIMEQDRAARPGLSGRHAVRQPAVRGRRSGDAEEDPGTGLLRGAGGEDAERLVDGLAAAAQQQGVTFSAQSVGGMFGLYFAAKPRHLRRSDGLRQGSLQPLLPCHAGEGRLSRAVGLRGRLRLGRAQRCRHRRDGRRGRGDVRAK